MIESQLSDKPGEGSTGSVGSTGGAGGTGGVGAAGAAGHGGTGGARMCDGSLVYCEAIEKPGCKDLEHDPKNCGQCGEVCGPGQHCKKGDCD